jgi:hypothetical protein
MSVDDEEDVEFNYAWFEHIYAWNRLLDAAGFIRYDTMGSDIERARERTYAALLMLADGAWATAEEVEDAAETGSDMEEVLIGLTYLREVETTMFDDGVMCFRLTSFGKAWAELMLLPESYE